MRGLWHHIVLAALVALLTGIVGMWVGAAADRLEQDQATESESEEAVATLANEGYCTGNLRKILRRVLTSCGLVKDGRPGRGCQPLEVKTVAAMSDSDFNSLLRPIASRSAIIQFDKGMADLDDAALALIEQTFLEEKGASYFLVASRASPEGTVEKNRALSKQRAEAVLSHLKTRFQGEQIEHKVGLLWLGEEYAQLDDAFCSWRRSRSKLECTTDDLNRSAFIAWIDCRL